MSGVFPSTHGMSCALIIAVRCRRSISFSSFENVKICRLRMSTQPEQESLSFWRKGINTIKRFGQDTKLLIGDIRKMMRIRKTMGGFKLSGATPMIRPNSNVTLENLRFVYKTSTDLKRTLPTLVLFCIPLVGYIAPFLALTFPEQLLSSHFWSEEQKRNLAEKSQKKRQESVHELSEVASKNNDPFSLAVKLIHNEGITAEAYGKEMNNIASINQLPTAHLRLLLRCWGVTQSVIPLHWFLCRKLRKHLHYIQSCDSIAHRQLQQQGLQQLSEDVITELVKERLPLFSTVSHDEHSLALRRWIEVKSTSSKECENENVNQVFLAHLVLTKPKEQDHVT